MSAYILWLMLTVQPYGPPTTFPFKPPCNWTCQELNHYGSRRPPAVRQHPDDTRTSGKR